MKSAARSTPSSIPSPIAAQPWWYRTLYAWPSPSRWPQERLEGVSTDTGIPREVIAALTSDAMGLLLTAARVAQLGMTVILSFLGVMAFGLPLLVAVLPVTAIEAPKVVFNRLRTAATMARGWASLSGLYGRAVWSVGIIGYGVSIAAALIVGFGLAADASIEYARGLHGGIDAATLQAMLESPSLQERLNAQYLAGMQARSSTPLDAQVAEYANAGALPPFVDLSRVFQGVSARAAQYGTVGFGLLCLELLSIALGSLLAVRRQLLCALCADTWNTSEHPPKDEEEAPEPGNTSERGGEPEPLPEGRVIPWPAQLELVSWNGVRPVDRALYLRVRRALIEDGAHLSYRKMRDFLSLRDIRASKEQRSLIQQRLQAEKLASWQGQYLRPTEGALERLTAIEAMEAQSQEQRAALVLE